MVIDTEELLLRSCTCRHVPKYRCGVVDVGAAEMHRTRCGICGTRLCNEDVKTRVNSRGVLEGDLGQCEAYANYQYWDYEDEYFQPSTIHSDMLAELGLFRMYIEKYSRRYPITSRDETRAIPSLDAPGIIVVRPFAFSGLGSDLPKDLFLTLSYQSPRLSIRSFEDSSGKRARPVSSDTF